MKEIIEEIADVAVAANEAAIQSDTKLPALRKRKEELQKGISNIIAVIEKGIASEALLSRITELESQVRDVDAQIEKEEKECFQLDKYQVIYWLSTFLDGDIEDDDFKRKLIDLLVNSVTVWDLPDGDFEITTAYNLTSCPSKTFRIPKKFGFEDKRFTLGCESELLRFVGSICLQTKRHSPP